MAAERIVTVLRDLEQLPGQHSTEAEPYPPAGALSEREHQVARLVGSGASNREIARQLFITEGTAKNHVTSILRKLDLRDRTQLALWVDRPTG